MINEDNLKTCYAFLRNAGMTHAGALGMLGNIYAESKCNPLCIEAQLIKRYKQEGFLKWDYGLSDERTYRQYWSYYDAGAISQEEFISPRQYTKAPHQYGAGICQWTSHDRKKLWLTLAKDDKKPLTDLGLQLNLLYYELKHNYTNVWNVCHLGINVDVVTNYVLRNFESPADPASLLKDRIAYANEIGKLVNGGTKTVLSPDKVINVAKNEVGYLEKASNSQLDSKTANAGRGNYTKYWRDLKPSFQGEAWCDCFVDWCFQKAYGKEAAQKLECGGFGEFYTPTSAQCYKNAGRFDKNAKVGDQIFFKNTTRIHHTGLVYGVQNGRVYTIEGNTSNGTAVVPNGGAVCMKSYALNNKNIAGYGHPRYDTASASATVTNGGNVYMFQPKNFKQGDKNTSVLLFQEIFNARNVWYKWGKTPLNLDMDCGPKTMEAVEWYKKQRKIVENGCGAKTWKDLIAM